VLRERLGPLQLLGLVLGVVGVALVVGLEAAESTARLGGLLLGGAGVLGLVVGTLWFGRFCRGVPLLAGATAQFVAAALVGAIGIALFETPRADWTPATIAALAWNTVAVSLGGMGLYFFLLKRGTAAGTTANFYLIPGTVAVLGWVLLHERLTPPAIAGFAIAAIGCWLVRRRPAASTGDRPTPC
jgi:drug/metabolite transporter (DMT)-like permease